MIKKHEEAYRKSVVEGRRIRFWEWEYGRRATEKNRQFFEEYWRGDFRNSIRSTDDIVVYIFEPPLKRIYFNSSEKGYRQTRGYRNSTDMLSALSSDRFLYKCPNISTIRVDGVQPMSSVISQDIFDEALGEVSTQYSVGKAEIIKIVKSLEDSFSEKLDRWCVSISLDQSPDVVGEFVKGVMQIQTVGDDPSRNDVISAMGHVNTAQKQELFNYHGIKRLPPESSTPSRLVGLWLWDCINENNCTQAEAIIALQDKFELEDARIGNVEPSDLRHFYRRTKECIEQGKILSFSKKGT